jgi:hypothetical protein
VNTLPAIFSFGTLIYFGVNIAMKRLTSCLLVSVAVVLASDHAGSAPQTNQAPKGFTSLFNGKDFTGWKVGSGDNGHWKVIDGVIDYDAKSEAKGEDKHLWSEKAYKDFILLIDWRLKTEQKGYMNKGVKVILPDGTHKKDGAGKEMNIEIEDVDSGIYLRGQDSAQVNMWMWPIGSGEVYGYRTKKNSSAAVKAGVTPKKKMDKPRGEWNSFEITMKGDRLWVKLNGEMVIENAQLPGIAKEGPIALQHHGTWNDKKGVWTGPPSMVQFKNIFIQELKD